MKELGKAILTLVLIGSIGVTAQAQILRRVQKKVEEKVDQKVDEVLNGKSGTATASASTPAGLPTLSEGAPFVAGSRIIFADDLRQDQEGRMPRYWQTHSTGSIVTVSGEDSKWLKLAPRASYQLDTLLSLPAKFTLEFDLLTRSGDAADIRNLSFGFSKNNTTRGYIYGVSADNTNVTTSLNFYYNTIRTSSNNTGNDSSFEFPLSNFANAKIHVGISVDNDEMQVYLNGAKVLDAVVFSPGVPKHFYISTDNWRKDASVFVSNMRIAE